MAFAQAAALPSEANICPYKQEDKMPRGGKSSYTDKQKRKAEHIEEGYEHRVISHDEAERRAWATVNKESGGGKKSGSGRGKAETMRRLVKAAGSADRARIMPSVRPHRKKAGKRAGKNTADHQRLSAMETTTFQLLEHE